MAIEPSGAASWTALFDAFKTRTGLFPSAVYNLPSEDNPRLAGGMTWTAEEHLAFLRVPRRCATACCTPTRTRGPSW